MRCGYVMGDIGGHGWLKLSDDFKSQPPMYRADILKDSLFDVLNAYNQARKELGFSVLSIEFDSKDGEGPAEDALGHRLGKDRP